MGRIAAHGRRLTFCLYNTEEEVDLATAAVAAIVRGGGRAPWRPGVLEAPRPRSSERAPAQA